MNPSISYSVKNSKRQGTIAQACAGGEDTPAAGAYGGVRGNLLVCEIFLRGFQSIFEPDGQNAQKQGGKFGGSRSKIFKQSI